MVTIEWVGEIPTNDPNVIQGVRIVHGVEGPITCDGQPGQPQHPLGRGEDYVEVIYHGQSGWGHRHYCREHGAEFIEKARNKEQGSATGD